MDGNTDIMFPLTTLLRCKCLFDSSNLSLPQTRLWPSGKIDLGLIVVG